MIAQIIVRAVQLSGFHFGIEGLLGFLRQILGHADVIVGKRCFFQMLWRPEEQLFMATSELSKTDALSSAPPESEKEAKKASAAILTAEIGFSLFLMAVICDLHFRAIVAARAGWMWSCSD